ncbi:MAG: hypothetical protein M3Y57_15925 [Acidobacteriota bacterium]|nr:hypothetical protein [Acidobacteriota bacterium]
MRTALFLIAFFLIAVFCAAADPLPVVCSLVAPVVGPRQPAKASVLVDSPPGSSLGFAWKATGGSLNHADKAETDWNPQGAPAGPYTLSVEVSGPDGARGNCSIVVMVDSDVRSTTPAPATGFAREVRPAFLFRGKHEEPQFGLYSYMLLGSPPNSSNRERYEAFLKSFLETVRVYKPLETQIPPPLLNVSYLPLIRETSYDLDSVLKNYDYERASELLLVVGEVLSATEAIHGDGPFIVSSDRPLSRGDRPSRLLFENLSTVPVPIVDLWVKQFRIQTTQEKWDSKANLSAVALRLRTAIEIGSMASIQARTAVAGLLTVFSK